MVKVKVPATSANVGVGFDCLGVALNLYTYFTFEPSDRFQISGCEPRFASEDNLVHTSFQKALAALGKEPMCVHIHIDSHVPVSRGLGSSATCVVGGVVGAYALTNTPIDKEAVLRLCTDIEHHPDNVAPAIFGGLVASYVDETNDVYHVSYPVDPRFTFLACIPDFETKTSDARKVLPEEVSFHTAVSNASKLSLVLKGFEMFDSQLLTVALKDEIHEPYRKKLIHGYEDVKAICLGVESVCFYISGSGSTLMNIMRDASKVATIQQQLTALPNHWTAIPLAVDTQGVQLC
ncbi:homoserine kinase [Erysipelotrichaceae bacterium MTC7]|nr:homoserine kinase [Erysipelotrichaceae bacterium MTC7]